MRGDRFASPAGADEIDHSPINEEARERHRPQMRHELQVADSRKRSDQDVLRVAGNRCHAADVGSGCHRQQVGQGLLAQPPGRGQNQRHHRQADDVVDEKSREKPAGENHRGQQMVRLQAAHDEVRDPVEKSRQVQVGDDQHHREQQHQGGEIDEAQGIFRAKDAEGKQQHRPDHRRARPINLHTGEFADGENHIARQEDGVGAECPQVGESLGGKMGHGDFVSPRTRYRCQGFRVSDSLPGGSSEEGGNQDCRIQAPAGLLERRKRRMTPAVMLPKSAPAAMVYPTQSSNCGKKPIQR